MIEPTYIAYRIDLKSKKEFYSIEEAMKFFKLTYNGVMSCVNGSNLTGFSKKQRWILFKASTSNKVIQQKLRSYHSDYVQWPSNQKSRSK